MNHVKISTRNADAVISAARVLVDAIQETNNELLNDLMHLQLAHAGIEEKDWMRHPEHLERDIEETKAASQFVFEVAQQVEKLTQLADHWRANFIEDLPSETRNR